MHTSETYEQMKLRLMVTIFHDKHLPTIGYKMRSELAEAEEWTVKLKDDEQDNEGKRPALPSSTKKINLAEISPYISNLFDEADQVCDNRDCKSVLLWSNDERSHRNNELWSNEDRGSRNILLWSNGNRS